MTYAVLSDIHANEIALANVLEDARHCGAEQLICLGDIVGYGPAPEKAVALIRENVAISLAGNHDDAVSGRLAPDDFLELAADAIARHKEELSPESLAWLKQLPYVFKGSSFICAHGDFTSPETFEYVMDATDAAANFKACREQLMFVGHTHIPGIFLTGTSGKVYELPPTDFTVESGKRYIVNPGSVGYPRTDGNICESTYVLYDDAAHTVTFRHLPFTVRSVMQTGRNPRRMKKRTMAAFAILTALMAGAVVWLTAPKGHVATAASVVTNNVVKVEVVTNSVLKETTKVVTNVLALARIDRTMDCPLSPETKKLHVHVRLAKGSPAAHIQLTFRNDAGRVLWEERWTAKRSKKATVRKPRNAVHATLSAGRAAGDAAATFDMFSLTTNLDVQERR